MVPGGLGPSLWGTTALHLGCVLHRGVVGDQCASQTEDAFSLWWKINSFYNVVLVYCYSRFVDKLSSKLFNKIRRAPNRDRKTHTTLRHGIPHRKFINHYTLAHGASFH